MGVFEAVLTGTGYPRPAGDRAGPGLLVLAGERAIQVDCGRGTVGRLATLGLLLGDLDALMLTHYHSDHVTDLADVLATRWILGPAAPLVIVGPPGLEALVEAVRRALAPDLRRRRAFAGRNDSLAVDVRVFERPQEDTFPVVLRCGEVAVRAARVDHGNVDEAVGYRFDHAGRALVVSGDTTRCANLARLAAGADVLVHEALHPELLMARTGARARYVIAYHSTPEQAGEVAAAAGVGRLVLTHLIPAPRDAADEAAFRDAAAVAFDGQIVVGRDLARLVM